MTNRREAHGVSEALDDAAGPVLELCSCPFEAVIPVTEPSRRERRPPRVEFGIRRRDDDGTRSRELEHDALERGETGSVEMLDHFHDGGRVEPGEARIAVHDGAVNQ